VLVFNGVLSTSSEDQWIMLELDTPYEYTSNDNLVITVYSKMINSAERPDDTFYCSSNTFYRAIVKRWSNEEPSNTAYRVNDFPHTRFIFDNGLPAPDSLMAFNEGENIKLNWQGPSERALSGSKATRFKNKNTERIMLNSYNVYRNNQLIANLGSDCFTYTDSNLVAGDNYSYNVTAVYMNPEGESVFSNTVNIIAGSSVYLPPVNLYAVNNYGAIRLNWQMGRLCLDQRFNQNVIPEGWINQDKNNNGTGWQISNENPNSGLYCIMSNSNGATENNWLISPMLNMGTNPVLSWKVSGTNIGSNYKIMISTSNTNEFQTMIYQGTVSDSLWERKSLNLFNYSNQQVFIAFVFLGGNEASVIRLDDIGVSLLTEENENAENGVLTGFRIYKNHNLIDAISSDVFNYLINDVSANDLYYVTALYPNGESMASNFLHPYNQGEVLIPLITKLKGNYPNPFNPVTTIAYDLARDQKVEIDIYNIKGQKVKKLINEIRKAGSYKTVWDGRNEDNQTVGSGIYFYRMKSGTYTSTGKMILMK
jgi:hypothetical protein